MYTGKIKFFNQEKSYGFIVPEEKGSDVFLHMTELEKSGYKGISIGAKVTYEVKTNHKGKSQATNIKIIGQLSSLFMQKSQVNTIKCNTLIFYLKNSEEEIALEDILNWLSQYTGTTIKVEQWL